MNTYKRISETVVQRNTSLTAMKSIFISPLVVTHSNLSHIPEVDVAVLGLNHTPLP